MKSLIAVPFAMLMVMSSQVSAACLYITDSFSGIVSGKQVDTAHGPFKITSANGCSNANIDVRVSALGVGRGPEVYIERQVGGSWKRETFGIGSNATYNGPLGTYRVQVNNDEELPKAYSGTNRYGR